MSDYMRVVAEARAQGDCSRLVAAVPYMAFMGIELEQRDGGIEAVMRYADHLIGNPTLPALHGGTLGALLESAAIFELLWQVELSTLPKVINISVDYLRSGQPVDTRARARVSRQGRRVATVGVDAWQDDPTRPIATARIKLRL